MITSETKSVSQIKPRLHQGRAGIKCKTIKLPAPPPLDKPIIQIAEKLILQQPQNINQPKTTPKVSVPESFQLHEKIIPVHNYTIPQKDLEIIQFLE